MKHEEEIRIQARDARTPPAAQPGEDPSLGVLFKQLAEDSRTLIRQEVALAKAEMRENVRDVAKDAAVLAMGGGLLAVGLLVLTAFLAALLGDLLGDNYWLGLLIVGVLYSGVGAIMLARGRKGLKNDGVKPEQTIESLRDDGRWAKSEIDDAKRDLASNP